MAESASPILEGLRGSMPNAVLAAGEADTPLWVRVAAPRILEVLQCLRDKEGIGCSRLVDLSAVDRGPAAGSERFELIYQLHSPSLSQRVRVHAPVSGASPEIASAAALFGCAAALEREVAELFGIVFRDHPDPRKLMLAEEFEGHPLRKDFGSARHASDASGESGESASASPPAAGVGEAP